MLAFFWLTNKKVSPESAFVFRGFNKGQTYVIYFQRMERNRQPGKPSVLPFTLAALDLSVSGETTLQNGTFPLERKRKYILTSLQKKRLQKTFGKTNPKETTAIEKPLPSFRVPPTQ